MKISLYRKSLCMIRIHLRSLFLCTLGREDGEGIGEDLFKRIELLHGMAHMCHVECGGRSRLMCNAPSVNGGARPERCVLIIRQKRFLCRADHRQRLNVRRTFGDEQRMIFKIAVEALLQARTHIEMCRHIFVTLSAGDCKIIFTVGHGMTLLFCCGVIL